MKRLASFFFVLLFSSILFAQSADFNTQGGPVEPNITPTDVFTTLTWDAIAPSTHAVSRSFSTYITIGGVDYIYQFGGGAAAQYTAVARYDVAANTWTTAGFAPIPSSMSSATAVTIGNMIYIFGGENTAGLGRTYMYDPVANTWTARANMLTPVTDALVVKFNDQYVYVIGGGTGLFGTGYFNKVQLYDVAANSYTYCTDYPIAAGMMGGGLLNHTIISAGGWDGVVAVSNAYKGVINPGNLTSITWTPIGAYPAGTITRMASAPVIASTTYPTSAGYFFAGGAIGGSTLTGNSYLYNYCTDAWETLTPAMPTPRSNMKAASKGLNEVYVIAGFTTVGVGTSHKATLSAIANNCFTLIPVELTAFVASVTGTSVSLNWSTATETNNSGFQVERSFNGSSFSPIGFIEGKGTTSEVQNYSFTDNTSQFGHYSYRLKQIDYNGSFEYSDVVEVEVVNPSVFALEQNYPNPFNPSTTISFSLAVDSKVSVKVFDILGQEVALLVNSAMTPGVHNVNFDASSLNSGVYFYQIEASGVDGSTFSSVKKMMLTK